MLEGYGIMQAITGRLLPAPYCYIGTQVDRWIINTTLEILIPVATILLIIWLIRQLKKRDK